MFGREKSDVVETLPMVPLRDVVVFPHMMIPFVIGRQSSIRALEHALARGKRIFLSAQHDATRDNPGPEEIYTLGTICSIVQSLKLPDGNVKVLVEGLDRARVLEFRDDGGLLKVVVKLALAAEEPESGLEALMSKVIGLFEQYVKLSNNLHYDAMLAAVRVEDPGKLADTISSHLVVAVEEKQNLLEILSAQERLTRISSILEAEVDKLNVDRRIQGRVKKQMERAQKEYYLNEKMKAIQKELGRKEDRTSEADELRKKVEQARMPKDAEEKAVQELKRLEAMPPMSAEATVSRNYLDWLIAVPWQKKTRERKDLTAAEKILNDDHYGLEKVKERIVEFLAVRQLVNNPKGPILCFVGPPGVGKTSLARSIARCTNRKFVRLSLGGVRDEAEIRGHRRTYIGAFPGQIIQMMKKAGTRNPVFLLDEVDKMSMDFRGDPSAALLEVLDPEQNHTFSDHYLDVEFDLSSVFFIATANVLHTIPQALQDRLEVIRLPGYTEREKIEIALRHLIPKQLKSHGLSEKNVSFGDDALDGARAPATPARPGCGTWSGRCPPSCARWRARWCSTGGDYTVAITARRTCPSSWACPATARRRRRSGTRSGSPPASPGPRWAARSCPSRSRSCRARAPCRLTGKLGDVMQESAHAALSFVRSRAEQFGIPRDFSRKVDVHIHVPGGGHPQGRALRRDHAVHGPRLRASPGCRCGGTWR